MSERFHHTTSGTARLFLALLAAALPAGPVAAADDVMVIHITSGRLAMATGTEHTDPITRISARASIDDGTCRQQPEARYLERIAATA